MNHRGMKLIDTVPSIAGKVVGIIAYQNQLIVAAEYRLYMLVDGKLEPIFFKILPSDEK